MQIKRFIRVYKRSRFIILIAIYYDYIKPEENLGP